MTDEGGTHSELPAEASGEGRVTVVGTAHVSQESVDEVERVIESEQPDVVAVELDDGRYKQLKGEAPEDLEASDLLQGNTVFQFLAYWMLSYLQTKLGERFDVEPGADMLAAVETAEENGLGIALVDRDIQTTVQRFWARLSLRERLSLIGGLLSEMGDPRVVGFSIGFAFSLAIGIAAEIFSGPFVVPSGNWTGGSIPILGGLGGVTIGIVDGLIVVLALAMAFGTPIALILTRIRAGASEEDFEEFDIESLTDTDVVTAMMEEFRRFSPGGAEALIDERDAYIGHNLVDLRDAGYSVVAVVGAGHREGIERYLDRPETLPPMETLTGKESTSRFSLYKLFGYAITLGFLAFFVLLLMAGLQDVFLLKVFAAWFLINGVIAAGLARLGGAHWPSAAVGGGIAWMTSVNPLLAPGWFAGYVELRYLTVNVGDIGTLNEILDDEEAPIGDIVSRMRDVPLFRLILVVAMTNIGSFIASILFAVTVFPVIAGQADCTVATSFGTLDGVGCLMHRGASRSAEAIWSLVS